MGLRINLRHANWLANVLAAAGEAPPLSSLGEDAGHSAELFHHFLEQLRLGFHSGKGREREWQAVIDRMHQLAEKENGGSGGIRDAAEIAREFLGERSWTALLLPSNSNSPVDKVLLNRAYLQRLVNIRPEDGGLILQLETPPTEQEVLSDLFPAFRRALSAASEWPGILLWRPHPRFSLFRRLGTEAEFFPLRGAADDIWAQSEWMFETLAQNPDASLSFIASTYRRMFDLDPRRRDDETTFIHLSDVHIGCREARLRLPRLPSLVRRIIREGGKFRKNVIIVSGDIMHTPNEDNLNRVRGFLQELSEIADEPLIICWGNHDVRYGGIWLQRLQEATRLVHNGDPVRSFCRGRLATVAFNSAQSGELARGTVGKQQMIDIGTMLDRHGSHDDASLIAILHHHPVSVNLPAWLRREFYERLMPSWFGHQTDRLTDADEFMAFLAARNFGCVLHGHKHIPHISRTPDGISVFGCGSSVGRVSTVDGSPYVSVNVVTFNAATRRLGARLLAERVDGGGLAEQDRAEILNLGTMRNGF